jgi:endonuclease/exonuclease/phosphatase family metal-dependent hydrolase
MATILSFNILAPCWAHPSYYPKGAVLDRKQRISAIVSVLLASDADVICLQEVTNPEYLEIRRALKGHVGFMSHHEPNYWSNWVTPDPPWEPNGNAVLLRKKLFTNVSFGETTVPDSGNRGVVARATHAISNTPYEIHSVHFDPDKMPNKVNELSSLLERVGGQVAVIAGDFNANTETGSLSPRLRELGFEDVLSALGVDTPTRPDTSTYANSPNYRQIDHIAVRGAAPVSGSVLDNGLENAYQSDEPGKQSETVKEKIRQALLYCGSDHYPVLGTTSQ